MSSKRRFEGELTIDHRFTPGLRPEEVAPGLPAGACQGLFEAPTYTCNHCCAVVVLNPLRNRTREYCRKCDHYIWDGCSAIMAKTKECKTFEKIIEEHQEEVENGKTIYIG